MDDCIFCKIIQGKIPSNIVYRDDEIVAFRDINPQTPTHLLIVPVKHITSLVDLTFKDAALMGNMITVANKLAKDEGIAESGYRLVINCGKQGGQLVAHLHMHVMGGRQLSGQLG
ncbi:MAG: histidine triad nucleotide-binding protein [Dehalococcoidales bacterium]|nr:histidine triad nucleotide-binding protein [Dehalococcoidales bacterium]